MSTIPAIEVSASSLDPRPSSEVSRSEGHPLDPLFLPKSVAVIGASERTGSVGRSVLWNLLRSPFGGTVFPVNAKRSNVLGIRAYPSLRDLPDKVDLVVVVTPADTVPGIIAESVELGVPAGIVISAGFKEFGARCGSSAPTAWA
jgi:acetyltransferase